MIRPEYSQRFRCIGPACEDSCCVGWAVLIDRPAYEKYQSVPAGPLRVLLDESIARTPETGSETSFAKIKMAQGSTCPILTEDRLCRIHKELGEEFLSHTCATYPRVVHKIDNLEEKALALSCPEAARLVLLDPDLALSGADGSYQLTWDDAAPGGRALLPFFWPIRELVIPLVRNRAYPLWQRMFLLGSFCRRLDAVARGEDQRGVAELLRSFSGAIQQGALREAMQKIPADPALQLDMVLRLAGLCRDRATIGARFLDCLDAFRQGIAAGPTSTFPALVEAYSAAHQRYFAPFFAEQPHILENYLINSVFRRQFPFGTKEGRILPDPETVREFALLVTQFALIRGLLIGVAGFHKEGFGAEHVVHTVQAASKHFEHHPGFLEQMRSLLASTGRDNAHGLTMLLRN